MGRVDEDEHTYEAAIRKVEEETGIKTEFVDLLMIRE